METQVNCDVCGYRELEHRSGQVWHFKESGLDNVFLRNIDTFHCPKCEKTYVSIPRSPELLRCIAEAILLKPGRLTGPEIRFLRKNLHLKIADFARLIGHNRVTLSSWENDKKQVQLHTDRTVRLLYLVSGAVSKKVRNQLLKRLQDQTKKGEVEYDVRLSPGKSSCSIRQLVA